MMDIYLQGWVGFVSSYCVKAMAILTALELGYNYGPKLTIFSDSKSVLSAERTI